MLVAQLSKTAIDNLGDIIRSEADGLNDETLNNLQQYRTSHRDTIAQIFNILCNKSRMVHHSAIVTYRIKRFESIIGKLVRYPEMRFSRMWDIAGCRCIFRNNEEVYRLKELLERDSRLEIVKEYDYIAAPQTDGYKSLHLFVKCIEYDKVVEVQIRNQSDHNWATLVEITDVLYETRIKEQGDNKDLGRFHFLLSDTTKIGLLEKLEIAEILKKYNYLEKLNEVFSRNSIKVRRQWFEIEVRHNHLLLTHLPSANYNQISVAYSNYILTFHAFQLEFYELLESLLKDSISKRQYISFYKIYKLYMSLSYHHIKNVMDEIREVDGLKNIKGGFKVKTKKQEWVLDLKKQMNDLRRRGEKLRVDLVPCIPKQYLARMIVRLIANIISTPYKNKINAYASELNAKGKA